MQPGLRPARAAARGATFDRVLNACAGSVAAFALFCMMWLPLADILSRKFGDHSIRGATEITEILLVAVIFAALPLVSWRGEHVMLDTLDSFISARVHAARRVLINLACAFIYGFLAWLMVGRGLRLASDGDTTSHLQLPVAPVVMAMALCLAVTGVVHLLLLVADAPVSVESSNEAPGASSAEPSP